MKTNIKLVATVAALIIAAAAVITFEACNKKKDAVNNIPLVVQNEGIVYQKAVPDRESYITEFEKKLQSASKTDEVLTLENANSFMFDILNYDFCNINGNGPDRSCETSTYTLTVSNGTINLSDFANLYAQISLHIYDYYHSLSLDNKNYYCIIPEIAEFDANATSTAVTVKTTLTSGYVSRDNVDPCESFICSSYLWDDAADTLTKYLNMYLAPCVSEETGRCFLSNYRSHTFYYNDAFFTTHPNVPTLYYCGNCTYNTLITDDEMCDLYWDYIDIAVAYIQRSCIVGYDVTALIGKINREDNPLHHSLFVQYADVECTSSGVDL